MCVCVCMYACVWSSLCLNTMNVYIEKRKFSNKDVKFQFQYFRIYIYRQNQINRLKQ